MVGIRELCSEAVGYPPEHNASFDTFQDDPADALWGIVLFSTAHRVCVSRAAVDANISNYSVFTAPLPAHTTTSPQRKLYIHSHAFTHRQTLATVGSVFTSSGTSVLCFISCMPISDERRAMTL